MLTTSHILVKASAEQHRRTWDNTYAEWGIKLTLDQYRDREQTLLNTPMAKECLTGWVLVEQADANTPDAAFVASCETYKVQAVVAWPVGNTADFHTRQMDVWSVASVYVPPQHRGKGYAQEMMRQLRERIVGMTPEQGDPTAPFTYASTLYSDIGKQFYARLGWSVHPSIAAVAVLGTVTHAHIPETLKIQDITSETISELVDLDNAVMVTRQSLATDRVYFYIPLTRARLEWRMARSQFYCSAFGLPAPRRLGVRVNLPDAGSSAWILWAHHPHASTLYVLRVHLDISTRDPEQLLDVAVALLRAAETEAAAFGLSKIELFAPDPTVRQIIADHPARLAAKWQVMERDESFSSLMCCKAGQRVPHRPISAEPSSGSSNGGDDHELAVEWLFNEQAWRTNNRDDFVELGRTMSSVTGCAVAIPSYRLSIPADDPKRPQHPSHVQDVALAVRFLHNNGTSYGYDSSRIYLIGHSAGAHMAAMLVHYGYLLDEPHLLTSIAGVVGVDGIYDIPQLLAEYPDYAVFLEQAFGSDQSSWRAASANQVLMDDQLRTSNLYNGKWAVIHSPDDELLTFRQSDLMVQWLQENWRSAERPLVQDYKTLHGKHDDLLKTSNFFSFVHDFVQL
ncbi:hypothetical protein RI367_003136 [Sorochytrium milnesiophthora]